MEICTPYRGDPHGDLQTSPQHADPRGFLVWFSLKRNQVHVDRVVVSWSVGHHVDHPCGGGGNFHGLPEKSLRNCTYRKSVVKHGHLASVAQPQSGIAGTVLWHVYAQSATEPN